VPEPSPADRAARDLVEASVSFRDRRPEDASDPDVPVAATVVLLRQGADGPEVLLIERPDRGSFAGAWVFPGGKLEPEDAGDDEESSARRAGARETREETGLTLDADALVPLSCWDPPPGIRLRIRTWFFVASDPGGVAVLAPDEVVRADWVRPQTMLERHARGEVTLYPPTWVTLHELAEQADVDALLSVARLGGLRRYETVARQSDGGPLLLWEGDAEYEGAGAAGTGRHRLELTALPWVFTRAD
jgi:8-oxo-dGTP pyrophosphatase MutT (NUDIX family)